VIQLLSMSEDSSKFWSNTYSNDEWIRMKFVFITGWVSLLGFVLLNLTNIDTPKGICLHFDCNWLQFISMKMIIAFLTLICSMYYLREQHMIMSLSGLSIISILILSAGESNGIPSRSELLSAVLIAQLVAYIKNRITHDQSALSQDRITYSVQVIAAAYMLSAFTKLRGLGFDWIFQEEELALNARIAILRIYADYGWTSAVEYADFVNGILSNNPIMVSIILFLTLVIESIAFVCFFGKKATILYGLLLVAFHTSIFLIMLVFVPPILMIVFVFILNGPTAMGNLFSKMKHKLGLLTQLSS
jgi:hypothetical protein